MAIKRSGLSAEVLKKAAELAVIRFHADRGRVEKALEQARAAEPNGTLVDFFSNLVERNLLTPAQALVLRQELNHDSLHAAPPLQANELAPDNGNSDLPGTASGYYLRTLGPYRLLRRLGQGGMGSVYLAYDEDQKRQVAIKALSDQLVSNPDYVERFYREAKNGALLNHQNIVRCISAGQDEETSKHYLVLEYVEGFSAHNLLEKMGRLAVGDAVHIILDIARGLEHAHSRNIIHRDIKPDNILITLSGVAKLADLGLAKRMDEASNLTALRQGFGSVYYIPYEQAFNARAADGRSDIYALGATLYHFLTGEVPFPGKSHMEIAEKKFNGAFTPARAINLDVPVSLDLIIKKMLARDPPGRYQMVSELIVDLERANLAAAIPSFIDQEVARRDPLVQNRLPSQPTQLDLETNVKNDRMGKMDPHTWYLRFKNGEGQWCKTKLSTAHVLERLVDGRIPDDVEASRHPQGEYRALGEYAEFRQAKIRVDKPHPMNGVVADREDPPRFDSPHQSSTVAKGYQVSKQVWVSLGLAVAALIILALFMGYWFHG